MTNQVTVTSPGELLSFPAHPTRLRTTASLVGSCNCVITAFFNPGSCNERLENHWDLPRQTKVAVCLCGL